MSAREELIDVEGVVSVYEYVVPHGSIPLVIVSKKIDRNILREKNISQQGAIFLTKKDIANGKDVFALRFLHMQKHATLLTGKDVLKDVIIKKKQARLSMESMLRVTLIDMRERLVTSPIDQGIMDTIALSIDRLASYSELLSGKEKKRKKHVNICLDVCKKNTMSYNALLTIYNELVAMTGLIDKM